MNRFDVLLKFKTLKLNRNFVTAEFDFIKRNKNIVDTLGNFNKSFWVPKGSLKYGKC